MAEILPLEDAVKKIDARTPIGSRLRSKEWEDVPLALRERAQFSAGVTSIKLLQTIQDRLSKQVKLEQEKLANGEEAMFDRSSFIDSIRDLARAEGLEPEEGKGSITDITSIPRLGMIYDIQNQMATGYARWKMDQSEGALMAYPAWRLVREADRDVPRDWVARWNEAGEEAGWEGAVQRPWVALKTSPIWAALSRFGVPWPPFDYNSGMGVEDVDYEEAVELGLLKDGEIPKATGEEDFNEGLKASVREVDPELRGQLKEAFQDQIEIDGDEVRWAGQKRSRPPRRAKKAPQPKPLPRSQEVDMDYEDYVDLMERSLAESQALSREETQLRKQQEEMWARGEYKTAIPIADKLRDLLQRRRQLDQPVLEAIAEPAARRGKVQLKVADAKPATMEVAKAGAEIVEKFVKADLLKSLGEIGVSQSRSKRASCDWGGKNINITQHTSASVAAHELMHAVEMRNPALLKRSAEFLFARTPGEKDFKLQRLKPGHGYRADERARKDRWEELGGDVYSGKVYSVGPATGPDVITSTELLTMGIERLYKSPTLFYSTDPNYFAFVIKAIKGLS
jgi:hypothetical protein